MLTRRQVGAGCVLITPLEPAMSGICPSLEIASLPGALVVLVWSLIRVDGIQVISRDANG